MKVLVNVARGHLSAAEPPVIDCVGIQLRETDDGAFDLVIFTAAPADDA